MRDLITDPTPAPTMGGEHQGQALVVIIPLISHFLVLFNFSLMLLPQQIIHGLHRIECGKRHLYEDSVPVAHRTVPQSWQLQGFELLTALTLTADESC